MLIRNNITVMSTVGNDDPVEIEFVDTNGTRMTWFRAFRDEFGYSNYGEYRTSVTQDIPLAAVIYACVLISIAALIAAAGIRGKERWYTLLRLIYSLAVGSIVLGTFMNEKNKFDYNEEITLEDVILGPKSELALGISRGLPQPLLSAVEYFSTDEGQIRFGRGYFMAGYIAHILLWTAFAFWVTGNILLCSVIWYGALLFTLTGICMVVASVVFHSLSPDEPIKLPCADGVLELSYGWCFWSNLILGAITTVVGLILFTLDHKVPNKLAEFFVLDTLPDDNADEYKQLGSHSGIPTRTNTPPTPLNMLSDRRKLSPVNWYMNNGYSPDHKENPVFSETINEETSMTPELSRPIAVFHDLIEEEERAKNVKTESVHNTNETQMVDNVNRLSEVRVDVEPKHVKGTTGYVNKIFVPGLHRK